MKLSFTRASLLTVKPGDVVVLAMKNLRGMAGVTEALVEIKRVFPNNKCIIVDGKISLVRNKRTKK